MTIAKKNIDYAKQADIFKALGHPTRLFLAHSLMKGEQCVCELNELVDIGQPTLSRHLKLMKDTGILKSRKDGMQVFYSIKLPCLLNNILECVEEKIY